MYFYDVNGNQISFVDGTRHTSPGGGSNLNGYVRATAVLQAPSDAADVGFVVWAVAQAHGPATWVVRPMLEEARADHAVPSPRQPGSYGIESKYALVTQSISTRVTSTENGVASYLASYTWALDVNGKVIGMQSVNNGRIGKITFSADVVEIIGATPGGGRNEFVGGKFYAYAPNGRRVVALGYGVT